MQYVGGKYRIRKQLVDFLLNYITDNEASCFVEPFVGSINVTNNLLEDSPLFVPNKIVLNDIHTDLIMMWKAIVYEGWEPPSSCTIEEYNILKNAESSALRGFIGHSCSFSGMWFDTFAKSRDRNYCLNGKNSVMSTGENLKWFNSSGREVLFYNLSYEQLEIPNGSLVYCDPPYLNTRKVGADKNFNHEKFWQWVRELSKNNTVFVSEYVAPEDLKCVLEIDVKLDLSQINRKEKLFTC